jgi:hypothetical protein
MEGWTTGARQARVREFLLHVSCHVWDVGHDLVGREEVVRIEGVDDALFACPKGPVLEMPPNMNSAQVVRVDER